MNPADVPVDFAVVEVSPIMTQNITYNTYTVWACFNAFFIGWIWFLVPETAGAALEDMDRFFETANGWIIGPTSKKRLKEIVDQRLARDAEMSVYRGEKEEIEGGGATERSENVAQSVTA